MTLKIIVKVVKKKYLKTNKDNLCKVPQEAPHIWFLSRPHILDSTSRQNLSENVTNKAFNHKLVLFRLVLFTEYGKKDWVGVQV